MMVTVSELWTICPSGSLANVPTAEKCEFINRDLAEPGVAESVVDGVTLVIHLAAIPSVPRSVLEPAKVATSERRGNACPTSVGS